MNIVKIMLRYLCHSILHRHVPETEFGTGSMKYLPVCAMGSQRNRFIEAVFYSPQNRVRCIFSMFILLDNDKLMDLKIYLWR